MKKILLSMMACAALCACTSDDALVDNLTTAEATNGLYMKFNISMADATRSTTETAESDDYVVSSDGIEEGTDAENNVKRVSIVLTTKDGDFIAKATEYSGSADTYYVATFEASDIEEYAGETVDVHVYCNMPFDLDEGEDVDDIYGDEEGENVETAWIDDAFFMSNAKEMAVELEEDLTPYKDITNPYNIGTVYVERSCARMDYKDGSKTEDFTYPMMADADGSNAQIDLVLSDIALINMSNEFYYLRHMAASADEGYTTADLDETTILTPETNINWVIDTDAKDKMSYAGEDLSDNFTYPLQYPGTWEWTNLASICKEGNLDNREDLQYHPWRYLTENTIPSIDAQQNGITTGVVFKAEIQPTTNCPEDLANAFESGERIFAFANEIVGTWDMVVTFATAEGNYDTALAAAYRNVMGQLTEESTAADLSAAQAAEGFTGYSPADDDNYYCYYYYWNRHNDNGQPGVMGTMEFDVVRNNVYKLSVTGINLFGHPTPVDPEDPDYDPTDPDPDPDPVEPDDPDEEDNIYIQVSVQILPWVVRVNNITF